jgi:hypothetical protein
MKTRNFETSFDSFAVFALSSEEMITVRGGNEGDSGPITIIPTPPIKM